MEKKRIGCVIAFRENHNNYGTSLQGYATIKKLQDLGYECEIINYIKKLPLSQKINYITNAIRAGELKSLYRQLTYKIILNTHPRYRESLAIRTKAVNLYKENKLKPFFRDYVGYDAVRQGTENYDAILVGSDQVWTPMSLPNKFFNLLFVKDSIRKISYASSFGVSKIPKFQHEATGNYLNRFRYISVREERAKEIVEELSEKTATLVADPTMLLTKEEWENEIENSHAVVTEPYIFCYFLGCNPVARDAVNELKRKTGLKVICIRHMDEYVSSDEHFGDFAPYNVDPNDFIKYIRHAKFVCTDSFHCSVFSIIFHRQFMTFYRFAQNAVTGRNSRITSLFKTLHIPEGHIYSGNINDISLPINYDEVDKRVEHLRNYSIEYLKNALQ